MVEILKVAILIKFQLSNKDNSINYQRANLIISV